MTFDAEQAERRASWNVANTVTWLSQSCLLYRETTVTVRRGMDTSTMSFASMLMIKQAALGDRVDVKIRGGNV